MQEPTKVEVRELLEANGMDPEAGEIISARFYLDPLGDELIRVLVDYGIAGTKVFEALTGSTEAGADVEPAEELRLEDMKYKDLQTFAKSLDLGAGGGAVALIVRIRAELEKRAAAALEEAEESEDVSDDESDDDSDDEADTSSDDE